MSALLADEKSVDAVHSGVDALVLSIFEAVLGHEAVTAESDASARAALTAAKCQTIREKYGAALEAVEHLTGIDKSPQEQEEEILRLSSLCKAARQRILDREAELIRRREQIDSSLKNIFSNDRLGLKN